MDLNQLLQIAQAPAMRDATRAAAAFVASELLLNPDAPLDQRLWALDYCRNAVARGPDVFFIAAVSLVADKTREQIVSMTQDDLKTIVRRIVPGLALPFRTAAAAAVSDAPSEG